MQITMPTLQTISLTGAALTTGLIAGLFYAYFCSVNPGLHQLADAEYLTAMQSINRAILNPVFFISFLGAPILLVLGTWLQYSPTISLRCWFLGGAAVVYLLGVVGVTGMGNIPLNEALDSLNLSALSPEELASQRSTFEGPWNSLNTTRTVASILSFVLVLIACINPNADQ